MDKEYPAQGTPTLRALALVLAIAVCAGCVGTGAVREAKPASLLDKALQAVRLKKPDDVAAFSQAKTVPIQLISGANLNSGLDNKAMALVVRVYRLKRTERFEQASFQTFLDEASERAALGDDLIGVTELVLQPGQRHEVVERLPPEANMIGVVGLFRAPAAKRWRLSFDGMKSLKEGVTVGLHACALTTSSSKSLITHLDGDSHSLATARCAR